MIITAPGVGAFLDQQVFTQIDVTQRWYLNRYHAASKNIGQATAVDLELALRLRVLTEQFDRALSELSVITVIITFFVVLQLAPFGDLARIHEGISVPFAC